MMNISSNRTVLIWIFVKMKQFSIPYTLYCMINVKKGNLI